MGNPYVPEMPGLRADPGHSFFSLRIALDKAEVSRLLPKLSEDPRIREFRADKINLREIGAQIDGKSGLMFTAARVVPRTSG